MAPAALSAELRLFFFNKAEGGAKFRLQCVSNPPANRCSIKLFASKGSVLCEDEGLTLANLNPFSCIEDLESGEKRCKYLNGTCVLPPKREIMDLPVKAAPPLPSVEDAPSAEELPDVEESAELKELPDIDEKVNEKTDVLPEVQAEPKTPLAPPAK